jgi:hypothetical protein
LKEPKLGGAWASAQLVNGMASALNRVIKQIPALGSAERPLTSDCGAQPHAVGRARAAQQQGL